MVSRVGVFGRCCGGVARAIGAVVVVCMSVAPPVSAQAAIGSVTVLPHPAVPRLHGQWAGPYELSPIDSWDGVQLCTGEIVHMAVLPPSIDPGPPATSVDQTRVMFITRNNAYKTLHTNNCVAWKDSDCPRCDDLDQSVWGRAYEWKPESVSAVTQIPLPPGYPQDGSEDFFCGGHAFLDDGSLLVSNGTDAETACLLDEAPYGSVGAWRLTTHVEPPVWVAAVGSQAPTPRWYPTVVQLADSSAWVFGHTGFPNPSTNKPSELRDLFTPPPTGPTWASGTPNRIVATGCPTTALLNVFDYPRIHMLGSGNLIWTSARAWSSGAWVPDRSAYLDLIAPYSCTDQRWTIGGHANGDTLFNHIDGSSVHLVTWDRAANEFVELLYVIGGSDRPIAALDVLDGTPLNSAMCADLATAGINKEVERIRLDPLTSNPAPTAEWAAAPDLNHARVNHNAVLLLDGSILVVGGVGWNGTTCEWRLVSERYMPPEVDESTSAGSWELQDNQDVARQYHSVAGLLPDGRVVSAGGANLPTDHEDWCVPDHTLEIFTPQYTFRGVTPAIDGSTLLDPAVAAYDYDQQFTFSVTIGATNTVDRVALVRPGSSTHAFDASQLYVELPVPTLPSGGGTVSVTAFTPPNAYLAPPGYYLVVVVDSGGRPSVGQWVRLDG